MCVLVTGGAGFIGSHLTKALIEEGYAVRVLDNLSSGSLDNLAGLPVEFIEGDVAEWDVVKTAVSGCRLVFHQAAFISAPLSLQYPTLNHRSNVTGTFHVFEAARQMAVERVIYASSAAVYGNLPNLPKAEHDPTAPVTPYAMAKRSAELMAAVYHRAYDLEFVGLRYMNVYGPRQDPSSPYSGVLSIFCKHLLSDKPLTIYGDGSQTRDFVYVADVVKANLAAATAKSKMLSKTAVFNIGSGRQTSLNDIVEQLGRIVGKEIKPDYQQPRAGDIKHSVADTNLAEQLLDFSATTTLTEGLTATLNWFKK